MTAAVAARSLTYRYGDRVALNDLSFEVAEGELFGLLGPNGGGKTTLFRVLSTLVPPQGGEASVGGFDVRSDPDGVRGVLGVTFQSPSLDAKLTVRENLTHHGHLYGLRGAALRERLAAVSERLGVADRLGDLCGGLSGGLKRRVEIAKGLLHDPRVLLLDEPSTGLDPTARFALWELLRDLQREDGVTTLVTTHLMEEAERCDRLAILDAGRLVAEGEPDDLRAAVGGDVLTLSTERPDELAEAVRGRFDLAPTVLDGRVRIETPAGHEALRDVMAVFGAEVTQVTLGKPTLGDVFTARTGKRFETGA
ncbi:ABC transporter ATP-binding protein [Alienimonas californiensis]|uniref:Daunorubicin/doxorubicin resistance ATP-binding protein DrrA n=1 Tax=Alienimonas californiensis TaxID=2527989 RepID=A0A517PE75_9PLAN|nr:ATP-binding cassette domain-containing protein [Alienimonas californiensis]QDT17687.1 Daunorubicin/doxorubicin resistance ATP-binding protein DrrA [Alienimonas californiensis]